MLLCLTSWCKPVICNILEIQNQVRGNESKSKILHLNLTYKNIMMSLKFTRETTEWECVYICVFLVLYTCLKVTFKVQAFFLDAQQSKSWYPLTQRECCETDQIRVIQMTRIYQDRVWVQRVACRAASCWPDAFPGDSQQNLYFPCWCLLDWPTACAGTQRDVRSSSDPGDGFMCCTRNFQGTDAASALLLPPLTMSFPQQI